MQTGPLRFEAFLTSRSPGRLLPKTSLFSVLGDIAATTTGGSVYWKAAPRLKLVGTASAQVQDDIVGGQVALRGRLALDDKWNGTLGAELRRVYFDTSRWVGIRATASLPLPWHFHAGAELELVRPDDPNGQGDLWPWALASVGYRPAPGWEVAAALEASAGPQYKHEIDALARLSYTFERAR